jgi:hypothetical protein
MADITLHRMLKLRERAEDEKERKSFKAILR